MSRNTVDARAYAIPLLHAAKYPASAVCGVLLGDNTEDGLHVKTAIPYFHHWTAVTPMLEVALRQSEIFAKKNNLSIVGWYQGNARAEDTVLPERAIKAAETIKKNNNNKAIIFLVNNKQFSNVADDECAITPYLSTENQWRKIKEPFTTEEAKFTEQNTFNKVRELFTTSAYNNIYDFDEHVEDVSLDWLNTSQIVV